MADVSATFAAWSSITGNNFPQGTATVGNGLDDNLRELAGVVVRGLSHKGADIASTSTTDIGAVEGLFHDITGTATISSFGTVRAGLLKILKYEGTLTVSHSANIALLTGANRTVKNGDVQILISEGGGAWRELSFNAAAVEAFTTGDVKLTIKTTADTGWVMMNDGTIGNASSGATSRANADTEQLFTLLWNNTANGDCAVSGGRGATAAADFAANKTIALPKALGRALAGYGAGSGLTSRAMGSITGTETVTLTQAQTALKAHTHNAGTLTVAAYEETSNTTNVLVQTDLGGASVNVSVSGATESTGDATATAHDNISPRVHLGVMIKL